MRTLGLALLFSGLVLNAAHSAQSEGRRMLVFALYGAAGTPGSAATTTVIDFSTKVACREARMSCTAESPRVPRLCDMRGAIAALAPD
jgi:hypothetical protein